MPAHDITAELVREYLDYDENTGKLFWRKRPSRSRMPVGSEAGSLHQAGYIQVTFFANRIYAHRLVWWWWYGEEPADFIDHINRNRADNRITNLRLATATENCQNTDAKGYVLLNRNLQKPWQAKIVSEGVRTHLGYYATKEEARSAYLRAKRVLHRYGMVSKMSL